MGPAGQDRAARFKYPKGVRVFICHASEDKVRMQQLCKNLRDDGFEPWLDDEHLLPGQDWELEINAAVRQSDAILVCLSSFSVEKVGFVQKELKRILDYAEYQPEGRIFVIPVRLEPCPVPVSLSKWQNADLFSQNGYERLRQGLRGRGTALVTKAIEFPRDWHGGDRRIGIRRVAIAGGLIAAGIVGVVLAGRVFWNPSSEIAKVSSAGAVPGGMIAIPGGRFLMGRNDSLDPEASPAHSVEVTPFFLDRVPVTNSRYRDFLRSSNRISPERASEPGATTIGRSLVSPGTKLRRTAWLRASGCPRKRNGNSRHEAPTGGSTHGAIRSPRARPTASNRRSVMRKQ
jgi:hypothetical protein